jgi:Predicted membrane protein (DUF2207)
MLVHHPEDQMRMLAWCGLLVVAAYYFLASIALRRRRRRGVRVAQYDPPPGISPAVAAYLWERGVSDKPFVVALANMACKGWLKVEQGPADYLLSRGDASPQLEDEEQVIDKELLRGSTSTQEVHGALVSTLHVGTDPACLSQLFTLGRTAQLVRATLEGAIVPELISSHFAWFIPGLTLSLWCFLAALSGELQGMGNYQAGWLPLIPGLLTVWALLATIRTIPAIIYKLASHLPGRTPHPLPFVNRDRTVLVMLLVALVSLAVFAWMSSPIFALQFGGFVLINLLGLVALRAPTAAGHRLLEQLSDFRMFLAQVDSDRVNRMNAPAAASPAAEKYGVWALALDVEHAWGEQFTAAVLNLLGPASAMASIESTAPGEGRAAAEIMDLHLR